MGLFDAFRKGLKKTRDALAAGLRSVLALGRRVDEQLLEELGDAMMAADVGPRTVASLLELLRGAWKSGRIKVAEDVLPFLKEHIASKWPASDRGIRFAPSGPTVIFVVGINGSGKTTSVAKLCNLLQKQGKRVLLGACDTFRAAAIEQLEIWSKRAGVEIVRHQAGSDPAAVAYDACDAGIARGVDVILIDTAGRLHTQEHLMRELEKIQRVVQKRVPEAPHEVLLVLDATIGQNAVNQAVMFAKAVRVTGLFLAKLDGSAKGGIVIGIRDQLDIPVKFVGLGETMDDVEPFDPGSFVEALLTQPAA